MSTKIICRLVLALLIVQLGHADEVARWDFEETSGMTASDQSGQLVVDLAGSDSLGVEGKWGSGIDFAGDGGATEAATVAARNSAMRVRMWTPRHHRIAGEAWRRGREIRPGSIRWPRDATVGEAPTWCESGTPGSR